MAKKTYPESQGYTPIGQHGPTKMGPLNTRSTNPFGTIAQVVNRIVRSPGGARKLRK